MVRNGRAGFAILSPLELALIDRDPVGATTLNDAVWPTTTPVPTLPTTARRCPIIYIDMPCTMTLFDRAVLVIILIDTTTIAGVIGVPAHFTTSADAIRRGHDLLDREPELVEAIMNGTVVGPSEHHQGAAAVAVGVSIGRLMGIVLTSGTRL